MKVLSTEIEIAAGRERVWEILADFDRYPEWNPFVRKIEGEKVVGGRLTVHIKPGDGKGITLKPEIVRFEKHEAFVWNGKLLIGGLFDGKHEFRLEPIDKDTTRFIHREEFTGILVPILWRMLEEDTRKGFIEMNKALRTAAEA